MLTYLQTKLNDEQYKAATHIDTSALILAGAGAGKTRTLTYKIAYLIYAKSISPRRIMAVTFTNKAANEMKQRLIELSKEIVQDPDLPTKHELLRPSDLKRVGTFHGIFLKILKEDIDKYQPDTTTEQHTHYRTSFSIYDSGESESVIKAILKANNRQDIVKHKDVKAIISQWKNKGVSASQALKICTSDTEEYAALTYEHYAKQLLNANALDFDDLLYIPHKLFAQNLEVLAKRQDKFDYVMVDEAQDTNQIQFELMLKLSKKCNNVTLIGDDYQSIYRRRGAVMENFLNVEKYRSDIHIFKLQINYRSRPHIVSAGQHLIGHNTNQYSKDITAHRKGDDTIKLFVYKDEYEEARHTINLIQKIKSDKNASRGDFAILYRMNSQSQVFEQMLVQEGIPYKIFGGFKFFDRREIKDVVAYLRSLRNPDDNIALERIINTPSRKIGKTTINKMKDYGETNNISLFNITKQIDSLPIDLGPSTRKSIKQFGHLLAFWTAGLGTLSVSELIQKIVNDIRYHEYLRKDNSEAEADEKYDNIGQLINFAKKFEQTGHQGIDDFIEEISLLSDPQETTTGTTDAIKLMTIHASKGLEFNAVSIVGCEENIFPMSRATFDSNELEEERRLMYVGITRAENHLFLSRAVSRMRRGQTQYNPASRFLSELPEELISSYDLTGGEGNSSQTSPLSKGDEVQHRIFGLGHIVELRGNSAIVHFDNAQYGIRKIDLKTLARA